MVGGRRGGGQIVWNLRSRHSEENNTGTSAKFNYYANLASCGALRSDVTLRSKIYKHTLT